jgi:hypothetical protein
MSTRVISAEENTQEKTQVKTPENETTSISTAVSDTIRENESSKAEVEITEMPNPELTVVENTHTAIQDEKDLLPKEVRASEDKTKTLTIPSYEELKKSELYMPIVSIESLNDSQLARAAQNKLAAEMDVRTFIYCFMHFYFCNNTELCKEFLVKSKTLSKGIKYITDTLKKNASGGSVGIGESRIIELFIEYLRLDDAEIAVKEAEAKALAEKQRKERAAAAKNKTKKPAKSSKAKKDTEKSSKPKAKAKKEKEEPSAQIDLFASLGGI